MKKKVMLLGILFLSLALTSFVSAALSPACESCLDECSLSLVDASDCQLDCEYDSQLEAYNYCTSMHEDCPPDEECTEVTGSC